MLSGDKEKQDLNEKLKAQLKKNLEKQEAIEEEKEEGEGEGGEPSRTSINMESMREEEKSLDDGLSFHE